MPVAVIMGQQDKEPRTQGQAYRNRKEPDMELVMGGLLVGVSSMLALLIVAVWKDSASHRAEPHPSQRRT